MSFTKKELEIHTHLAELYEHYRDLEFIHFEKTTEISGVQFLERLITSIRDKKVLKIYYQPYYEDKPYFIDVHPYILGEYKFRWYLIGLNAFKNQIRTYALDRMRDIREAEDIHYIERTFSADEYFKNSIGIISPEGEPPLIKAAIQKTQAQYLISQPWHASQNIVEETDEEIVFSFRVHPTYEFRSLLLGLGKDALVLEPPALREDIQKELAEMITRYGTSGS